MTYFNVGAGLRKSIARRHAAAEMMEADVYDYFFSGAEYIEVPRGDIGPGKVSPGYPAPISNWGWGAFGADGIDAALYSGSQCYFFSGAEYIQVTRGETGPGTVDPGYPAPISNWGWGAFGADGIDAALYSGSQCYFFSGAEYIRVTRGETGPGTVDPGYPAPISNWGWGTFGAAGIDAALYSGPVCYFFSGAEYIRVHRADAGAGRVDPNYPAPISNWGWGTFGADGIDAALYSGGPLLAPPSGGLRSASNYVLYSDCNQLSGVSITIDVTEDLVAAPPTAGEQHGFSFQLNAWSPQNTANPQDPEWIVWQQYVIGVRPTSIVGAVNNWTAASLAGEQTINSPTLLLLAPPQPDMIPAGTQLTIALLTDQHGNVNGVTFAATPGQSHTLMLTSLTKTSGGAVTSADLAPIVAIELNLVGPGDGKFANLISGAGTITYAASNSLEPLPSLPPCIAPSSSRGTGESSTSIYGELPSTPSTTFTQSFGIQPATPT